MAEWKPRIRALINNGWTPEDAVERAMKEISAEEWEEYLRDLLLAEARRLRRDRVRRNEHRAAAQIEAGADPAKVIGDFVHDGFTLPDGDATWVHYWSATAEEHELKALWYYDQAAAHTKAAEWHEACAAWIREAGVTCLRDLPSRDQERALVGAPS